MHKKLNTNKLILCGFFAALTAACSIISIPLPFSPVPVNLATLSVFLSGILLGAKGGALSQFVYVSLGAVGLPVFHNFTGGPAVLAGPTGGFLAGYIAAAFIVGEVSKSGHNREFTVSHDGRRSKIKGRLLKQKEPSLLIGCTIGLFICYALGTLWFMFVMGSGLWTALILCVFPFLPGDAVKIIIAIIITVKLKPFIENIN